MTEPVETNTKTKPQSLGALLTRLVESSGALVAILITREGTVLAEAGTLKSLNSTAVAALVAGMYSATREVARIVGEQQFSILLQQGERRHIHMSLVDERAMLVILFEDYQRIGRVRLEARKTADELVEVLQQAQRKTATNQIEADDFKRHALNLVDRIFAGS